MASAVYILCALTSIACTVLLLRGYAKSRVRLLLWSGLGFALFAMNNIVVFIDLVVARDISLLQLRNASTLGGLLLLLYGLIVDVRE
jgi:hypothetical protein